jgi:HEAT repeat protein
MRRRKIKIAATNIRFPEETMNGSLTSKQVLLNEYAAEMLRKNIDKLGSKNGLQRLQARSAMIALGESAIDIFAELVMHPNWIVRREAVKALSQMKTNITAPVLIYALEDEYASIRWVAAEGLIALGKQGLLVLMQRLCSQKLSVNLSQVAHHVVKEISKRQSMIETEELLANLENPSRYYMVPVNARNVLNLLSSN